MTDEKKPTGGIGISFDIDLLRKKETRIKKNEPDSDVAPEVVEHQDSDEPKDGGPTDKPS